MSAVNPKQVKRDEEEGIMLFSAVKSLVQREDEQRVSTERSFSLLRH